MPEQGGFRLTFTHVLNTVYLILIGVIFYIAYQVYLVIHDFFNPEQTVVRLENAELIEQQVDDLLLTSRAHIDAYLVLKKSPDGQYASTKESLQYVRRKQFKLKDDDSRNDRQLCVYSVDVSFGYRSWNEIVTEAKNGTRDAAWPEVTGIFTKRRAAAPDTTAVTAACHDQFSGTMEGIFRNTVVISDWLASDSIYRTHMEQGINQVVDIALWELSVECSEASTAALSAQCEQRQANVHAWKAFQLNEAEDIMSAGRDSGTPVLGLPRLTAAPVRGVYKETYSSLIFVNAKGRLGILPFTRDWEVAVQRDVMTVTYGSTIYFRQARTDYARNVVLYASTPDVVMRSLAKSEYALFGNDDLDELRDAVGMGVADYLQTKSTDMIDAEIAANRGRAIETSKAILSQKLSMLKPVVESDSGSTRSSLIVKYTDVAPDHVAFTDFSWRSFIEQLRK